MNLTSVIYLSILTVASAISVVFGLLYLKSRPKRKKQQLKSIGNNSLPQRTNKIHRHLSRKKYSGLNFADTIEMKKKKIQQINNEELKFSRNSKVIKPKITIVNDSSGIFKNTGADLSIEGQEYNFRK